MEIRHSHRQKLAQGSPHPHPRGGGKAEEPGGGEAEGPGCGGGGGSGREQEGERERRGSGCGNRPSPPPSGLPAAGEMTSGPQERGNQGSWRDRRGREPRAWGGTQPQGDLGARLDRASRGAKSQGHGQPPSRTVSGAWGVPERGRGGDLWVTCQGSRHVCSELSCFLLTITSKTRHQGPRQTDSETEA